MITPYEEAILRGVDPWLAAAAYIETSGVYGALWPIKPNTLDIDNLLDIKLNYYKKMDTATNTNYPAKTTGLDFTEAMQAITAGFKVRVPEWTGYWFRNGKDIAVFTRTGDVLNTPNYNNYVMRDDWQIVTEGLGFDFAILALKAGKAVRRSSWVDGIYIIMNQAGGPISTPWILAVNPNVGSYTWGPYSVELFSTDWEIFDPVQPAVDMMFGNQKITHIQSSQEIEHPGLD